MRPAFFLTVSLLGGGFLYGQQPATTDPHEDPRANGGNKTGDTKPLPRDPHAVPDPVPVRPADPNAPNADSPAAGTKPVTDRELMRKIRDVLLKDRSVAKSLDHVQVIAHAGRVLLQGMVPSAEIRHAIEQKATGVAGEDKVSNELIVEESADRSAADRDAKPGK